MTLSAKLKSQFLRLCYPHGSVRRVWRGPVKGMSFVVQSGMGATFGLGIDCHNLGFFPDKIRPGMHVLDVGGNCGQMALLFSRLVGSSGLVVTLEPAPRNFVVLRQNLKLNDCRNVTPRQVAAGRKTGKCAFSFDEGSHMEGGLAEIHEAMGVHRGIIEVDCDTLDNVVRETGITPHVLKLDVEGGGGEAFAGSVDFITKHRPHIYFEMHSASFECPEYVSLMTLRRDFSYELQTLEGEIITELNPAWGYPVWCVPKADIPFHHA